MADRVREAAVECPSENELTFDGELEETVAIGFFGRGISNPMFVENFRQNRFTWSDNLFHSFEEQLEDLGEEDENDFSAAMAECAGGGGRRRATKAVVDIHQCLAIGGRTDGDPVMEFIVAHVGTTEVPVVKADKNKAFSVQVWQLFCALALNEVSTGGGPVDEASKFMAANNAFLRIYGGNYKGHSYWQPEFYAKLPYEDLPVCVDTYIQGQQ